MVRSLVMLMLSLAAGLQIKDNTEQKLTQTLHALEQGLDFMQQKHQSINLDGVIGTRLVEGQLEVILQHLNALDSPVVSVETERMIEELRQRATDLSDAALPFVLVSQPEYYARIGTIIQKGFWTQDHPSQDINPEMVMKPKVQGEAMHEKDSDDCLTELFGTSGLSKQHCRVSRYCWKLMSSPSYRGYSLSHQLFYMLIAESTGCLPADIEDTVNNLSAGFCANMMVQAKTIAQQGFPDNDQDLFMEIQALCGVSGFRQFLKDDWLNKILEWQWQPQGCWGEQNSQGSGKAKREERVLSDGCESHRTAVALGALVQNVRYIIEVLQNLPASKEF